MEPITFPIRINRYLALHNYSTRRGADELITKRKVFINGKVAVLGDMVQEGDAVEVDEGRKKQEYIYYAYHKPRGIISHSPQGEEKSISQMLRRADIFPVGRLDKDSYGLLILTNDGRITDKLLNPKYPHEKEYVVKVRNKLRSNFKEKMEGGVDIEGYKTQPAKVKILNEYTFKIILTEGKKHQIRRMVSALHNDVVDLKRIRIMNIHLGTQASNQIRKLEDDELNEFLSLLGMQEFK